MCFNLKKRLVKGIGGAILAVMMVTLNGSIVWGNFGTGTVKVPLNQVMAKAETVTRTGAYSFITVGALSVYPTKINAEDNYTKCVAQLYAPNSNVNISDKIILTENSLYSQLPLCQGKLNYTTFDLCFSGNNPKYAAYVDYYFNGN